MLNIANLSPIAKRSISDLSLMYWFVLQKYLWVLFNYFAQSIAKGFIGVDFSIMIR